MLAPVLAVLAGVACACLLCSLSYVVTVFPDVDLDTGLITAEHVAQVISPRTKAIIAVHFYGQVCDMDPIVALARRHGLVVIEDVCQAIFAEYKGRRAGSIGDIGCFTFDDSKL